MLSYLSVLSAYLKKKQKKTGLPKTAGGYELLFKNTDHAKQDETFFFCRFCNGCLIFVVPIILSIVYH